MVENQKNMTAMQIFQRHLQEFGQKHLLKKVIKIDAYKLNNRDIDQNNF